MNSFQSLRAHYKTALQRFVASPKAFEVIQTVPAQQQQQQQQTSPPELLYVLDSSFNPPTTAHLRIAVSALLDKPTVSSRLLLLLATQNADKPSKPALFEDRLAMMELFAGDLLEYVRANLLETATQGEQPQLLPQIDIGVTKRPYFVDKAVEIEEAAIYPPTLEQVHLTGYDTLIRIFDTKYYPPSHTLQPLAPFLSRHRLRVTLRPDSDWGGREEQKAFLLNLAQGGRESEGGQREWASRLDFVEGKQPGDRAVSSTIARQAVRDRPDDLEWLVPRGVREYLTDQNNIYSS
ncbi:hypothetical protein ASPZODRAFT_153594 [Penicilliopsis zonata CBS 506.65]|uniref:Uncharacterized protein n=1 Tax=Penicilliopsis zonata CBS 506.65 TaxID=1073090 RepID=A0A1L9SC31_9EURO|nr:hypothetical protein ASPZODRAFT_153594 [Penicilliopsis zonata CBS 506.65]OJJ44699.1 hypothetical protein ASPZODRAFT_153594 [Penicilliopsis zonata CBS 506.65]